MLLIGILTAIWEDKNVILLPIMRVHNNFVPSPPSPYADSDLIFLAW